VENSEHPGYVTSKGLQRPLEAFGLRGRYIYWAAGTVIATFLLFVAGFIFSGFTAGLIMSTAVLGIGGGLTFLKQSKGLYSKKEDKGVFIFARSIGD
jgi:hypothetical protein